MCIHVTSTGLFRGTNALMAQWRQKDDKVRVREFSPGYAWRYRRSLGIRVQRYGLHANAPCSSTLQWLDSWPAFRCCWMLPPGHRTLGAHSPEPSWSHPSYSGLAKPLSSQIGATDACGVCVHLVAATHMRHVGSITWRSICWCELETYM